LKEFRAEIVSDLRWEANVAEGMGDPEASGRLRDIAREISRKRLTVESSKT